MGSVYFVSASVPAALARFGNGVAFIWVANALLLAVMMRRPTRDWPVLLALGGIASVCATALFGMGARAALPLALINMSEVMAGAVGLRRIARTDLRLTDVRDIVWLVVIALGSAAATGLGGAAVAVVTAGARFGANWLAWTTGHTLGALITIPLALLFLHGDASGWARSSSKRDHWLAAAFLLLLAGTVCAVFVQTTYPLLFLPFLPLMLCVFRFGRLGAAIGLVVMTILSAGFTLCGWGPIHLIHAGAGDRAEFLQLYLAVATMMALPAAAELKRRRRLYSDLQRNAALYRVIVHRTGDLLMTTGLDGVVSYVSPSITAVSGFAAQDVVGKQARDLILPEDHDRVSAAHAAAIRNPSATTMVEYRARTASGALAWYESHIHAMVDDGGAVTGAVTIVREISGRKARETDLEAAANSDPLTGLANRRAFEEAFASLARQPAGGPIGCIAMFDLDHFKRINDAHGHSGGDQVLAAFAALLLRSMRGQDVVARLGGEEFGAILVGADLAQAERVCERIRRTLADTAIRLASGDAVGLTVSAGLASITASETLASAMATADMALYQAKDGGRNRLAIA